MCLDTSVIFIVTYLYWVKGQALLFFMALGNLCPSSIFQNFCHRERAPGGKQSSNEKMKWPCSFFAQCLCQWWIWSASRSRTSCTLATGSCAPPRSTRTWWRWPSTTRRKTFLSLSSWPISLPRSVLMIIRLLANPCHMMLRKISYH